jgi:hypothetical protein
MLMFLPGWDLGIVLTLLSVLGDRIPTLLMELLLRPLMPNLL